MHYLIRPVLLVALLMTVVSSLGACNLSQKLGEPATDLIETATFAPEPLFAGSRFATLDLKLKRGGLRRVQAYTAGIGGSVANSPTAIIKARAVT